MNRPDLVSKNPVDSAAATMVQELAHQVGAMVRISGSKQILSPPLVLTEYDCPYLWSLLKIPVVVECGVSRVYVTEVLL